RRPRQHVRLPRGGARPERRHREAPPVLRRERRALRVVPLLRRPVQPQPLREPDVDAVHGGRAHVAAENAWPYNTVARPVPRGHRPAARGFGGAVLMERLSSAAGAATHPDTQATNLVLDGDGRVAGLVARRYGERVTYRARQAVVITTGGFVDHEEVLAHHPPVLLGHGKVSDGLDDGSGIRM